MMKNSILLLAFTASLFLHACDDDIQEKVIPKPIKIDLSGSEMQMTNEEKVFATNLFSTILEKNAKDENIIISPLSLNMVLAMVWNGAEGETKQAIRKAMGLSDYPQVEVNTYFKKLMETLLITDPTVKLAIANSIWPRKGFPVKTNFYDTNKKYYNAEVRELDFSSPEAPVIINQWCADNTNGLINKMIEGISDDMVMYLLNALYFKGAWSNGYEFVAPATSEEYFTKENGERIPVKMMQQNNTLRYYQDEFLVSTSLPYGNNAFSMTFILPNSDISLEEVINRLKEANYFETCLQSGAQFNVDLFIPKFKLEYETGLNDVLQQLGMGIAFSNRADFFGISVVPLQISVVRQKCTLEVNEEGSEASAVTIIESFGSSLDPNPTPQKAVFRADRPFLFAIQENSTGTVLFMGKIGKP